MNGDDPLVVTNKNDPVRVINAVGTIASPLILAYIAAFGAPAAKTQPPAVDQPRPMTVEEGVEALSKKLDERFDDLKKSLPPVKK